jgi:putative tryptophan/tyrosine transport system substrate-binding protein
MKRRDFITLVGAAAATWPRAARAQQSGKVWRIGFLSSATPPALFGLSFNAGLAKGMRELGYTEGKDFVIDWRSAEGRYERLPDLAAELVRLKVDVIVVGSAPGVRSAQQATNTIPIVMSYSVDPVGNGFVASLARPGGNTTGLAASSDDSSPKQLELLTTIVPGLSRVGLLTNPGNPNSPPILKSAQAAAEKAGLVVVPVDASNPQELESAFAILIKERVGGIMVAMDAFLLVQGQRLAEFALRNRLPSIFSHRDFTEVGGLMSYGESVEQFYRARRPSWTRFSRARSRATYPSNNRRCFISLSTQRPRRSSAWKFRRCSSPSPTR